MKRISALIIAIVLLTVMVSDTWGAEKTLVYVAGNPNLYPIEYYDSKDKEYKGVIPQLLKEFSDNSQYEIVYLRPGEEDNRKYLLKNLQVELVSGCQLQDGFDEELWNAGITVIRAERQGIDKEIRILLTEIVDDNLANSLSEYLSNISEKKMNGLMLESIDSFQARNNTLVKMIAGSIVFALLASLVIVVLVTGSKYRNLKKFLETDSLTNMVNMAGLEGIYRKIVNRHNCVLYKAIYYRIDLRKLGELCSRSEIDNILKKTAGVLTDHEGEYDLLVRAKDDAFLMLKMCVSDIKLEQFLSSVIEKVNNLIAGQAGATSCFYAGVCNMESHNEDIMDIAFKAEQACMHAARNDKEYSFFSNSIANTLEEESEVLKNFERAIYNEEIKLYLHFFVDPKSNSIVGAEALARWHHPRLGILLPERFVHALEREGKASILDYHILNRTCSLLEYLYQQGIDDFFISFNLSRKTLESEKLVETVTSIINEHNFKHDTLILEVTESYLQKDMSKTYENLRRIKEDGIHVVLDDFGYGSSFDDLYEYEFEGLKIDRKLINRVETERGKVVVKGIIDICHEMSMTVFGEGAETLDTVQNLIELGCDAIQGYYYYQPLPVEEALKIIMNNKD
ncbi:MAG: EAL domain-containing protein [Clostridia bacterium]|jgi:EAL domain-containing protein (putative c-di-GMP-specific phosphodiesterase class I)/GGDEF domain-containing protein